MNSLTLHPAPGLSAVPTAPATPTELAALLHSIAGLVSGEVPCTLPTFGVAQGQGGAILFNCHYAAFTGEERYYDLARQQLQQVLGQLNPAAYRSYGGTRYFQELAELGGLLDYLIRHGHLDWDAEPLLRQFDELLEGRLQHFLALKNLEIVNGALSAGQYFLRRAPRSARARRNLSMLLDALQATQEGDETGGYYWTCHLIKEPRVYTGFSHGSAMVINFVAGVYEAGHERDKCVRLLHYASRFVLGTRMDPARYGSSIPLWRGREEFTINLCLIYGDPSTAYALIRAAKLLGNAEDLAEATRIALLTTRPEAPQSPFPDDASVYYGAAGAYLVYAALHRQTGEPAFAAAASRWVTSIPALAVYPNEYLNFSTNYFRVSHNQHVQLNFNFGLLGVGLALLQTLSQGRHSVDEFTWLA
jgi:lantibiotic biosynthesis protein